MRVADVCTREAVTLPVTATLREAALAMRNSHVGALVVVDGEGEAQRPVGILTDRDIVIGVLAVPGARPEGIRAVDVMPPKLFVAREDESVMDAAATMRAHGVRRLAVVDARGRLHGVLSTDDILRAVSDTLGALSGALLSGAEREIIERHRLGPAGP